MARIPQEEIDQLKRDVSVQRLAEAHGVELKRHGQDLLGLCPFHDDREPSLVISPKKNLWHCLGACQAGGTAIDWVMRAERVSFRDAVERLQRQFSPLAASRQTPASEASLDKPVQAVAPYTTAERALLGEVVSFYHEALKRSPDALDYLKSRGLECQETIDHFQLGYSNRTLGKRLLAERPNDREQLIRLGILRESGHEHFNGSLVIPVFDLEGGVTELYGRKTGKAFHAGTPLHLYLPGPHRGVFNEQSLEGAKDVILCEALIDALTFWSAGFRNVTSSYGIEGFTDDHLAAFKRHRVEKVLIAYDRDEAGERAAKTLAKKLFAEGLDCWRVQFPKGMDANEYALQVRPAKRSLGLVLDKVVWMGEGAAAGAQRGAGRAVPAAVAAKGEEASPAPVAQAEPSAVAESSPLAAQPPTTSPGEVQGDQVTLHIGERTYRIRGLARSANSDQFKVNVFVSQGPRFFVDTLDLYSAKQRTSFLKCAAEELSVQLEILKRELDQVLLQLETIKAETLEKALQPKGPAPVVLSEAERDAALELLRAPNLTERILGDFERCGVVGEEMNKLVGYLACVSRKLEAPLAVVIQSSSAAGKSALMEAILALIPKEEQVKYSAMTGQSLFYMQGTSLSHKVLAIVEEEGAQRASYALKLLQSEGELTIAATGKDPVTGKLLTQEYRVEGPVMIFLTTTAINLDEELLNRCLVLSVDEDRAQTQAIQRRQRQAQTLDGLLLKRERDQVAKLHQDAQRLLRPLRVVNPYAERLTFLDDKTRTRRDHVKYLTLIRATALLHQYQRPVHRLTHLGDVIEYIEVLPSDIALANSVAHEVLGRSLDELPPQTRRVLELVEAMAAESMKRLGLARSDYRFSRRDLREYSGLGNTQLRLHLDRLQELEYVVPHRGTRGQSFVYELVYDGRGKEGERFLPGLIDVDALLELVAHDKKFAGSKQQFAGLGDEFAAPFRATFGPFSAPFRGRQNGHGPSNGAGEIEDGSSEGSKSTYTVPQRKTVVPPVVHRNGHAATSPLAAEPVRQAD